MGNRKRLLTGFEQTGKQKSESGFDGNWILKIWREPKNRPSLERRAQTSAPVRDGTGSRG